MPVYNGERWLSRAVESVLAQTFVDWELVVVDDGSTDGSVAIVESFVERDPRVRLVRTVHAGVRVARSVTLVEARARFVAFLDADDEWLPRRLERQLPFVDERTVVFSDFSYLSGASATRSGRHRGLGVEYPTSDFLPHLLARGSFMIGTVLAPRELLVDAGAFRYGEAHGLSSDGMAGDFEMWLLLALRGARFHYLDEQLATYRRHPDSLGADWPSVLFAIEAVLDGLAREAGGRDRRLLRREKRKTREIAFRKRGWQQILAGNSHAARRQLAHSLRTRPHSPRAWLALSLAMCPPQVARRFVRGRI
jgi:teichuronic acid biosynthesis glycosyltransferase TuaG